MFVLMKDGPSVILNNIFELECVGTYKTRDEALAALRVNYDKAHEEVDELGLESTEWFDENKLEATVADEWDYGVALRVFEV